MWWLKWSRFVTLFLTANQPVCIQKVQVMHVLWATSTGEDGTRALQVWVQTGLASLCSRQSLPLKWSLSIFLKETAEACIKRERGNQIRKKILKFPIVLCIASSALQFYKMFRIYLLLYSTFQCIWFSIRFFNNSSEYVSFNHTFQT